MMQPFSRWLALWRRAWGSAGPRGADEEAVSTGTAMLDCEQVMRQLWDYLDAELTPERMVAMRVHLELCRRCFPQYEFERSFLDAVAASARTHSDLEQLRRRVVARLQEQGLSGA